MVWEDGSEQRHLGIPNKPPSGSGGRLFSLLVALGVVLISVVLYRTIYPAPPEPPQPAVGQALTKLQLTPLTGEGDTLTSASLKGQVVLINFWGPWCGPCRLELPELVELRKDLLSNSEFRFVSVSCMPSEDESDLVSTTTSFLKSEGYDFPVHRDATLATRIELLHLNQGNFAFPTTVLLDRQGTIRNLWIGYRPDVALDMRQAIDALLAESQPVTK